MAQDIVADALNQIMNARRVEKREVIIKRSSKVLIGVLEMMKANGHVDFEVSEDGKVVTVKILKINECRAIKPRYSANVEGIEKYVRRFLPSRNFGTLVISTNKGFMDQKAAVENNVGGTLIAYFY